MQILLTGVTGLFGRAVARQLIAAGHTMTGIAAEPDEYLHPDVEFVRGSLGDPMLQQLADVSDVVLHLAPVELAVPGSAGINGLVHVVRAAARAGSRLIYLSQSAGQPKLYGRPRRWSPPAGRPVWWCG